MIGGGGRKVFLMHAILRLETGVRVARVARETTGKTVSAVSYGDVVDFYGKTFRPDLTTIVIIAADE